MDMRATISDTRGHTRGVWGSGVILSPSQQRLEPAVVQSIRSECQHYLDSQWRDSDTIKLQQEIRHDTSRRLEWITRLKKRLLRLPRWMKWVSVTALIITLIAWMFVVPEIAIPNVVKLIIAAPFYLFFALMFIPGSRGQWPPVPIRVRVAAMLNHGLCADCGYSIQGLPVESDGSTVCPECGAAWKLPPQ